MAIDYLQAPGPKPAYRRWFGVHDAARASTVERIFTNFRSNDLSDFTFACDCPEPINHAWGTYTFQSWNHHSIANEVLGQLMKNPKLYTSAMACGISPWMVWMSPRP